MEEREKKRFKWMGNLFRMNHPTGWRKRIGVRKGKERNGTWQLKGMRGGRL